MVRSTLAQRFAHCGSILTTNVTALALYLACSALVFYEALNDGKSGYAWIYTSKFGPLYSGRIQKMLLPLPLIIN